MIDLNKEPVVRRFALNKIHPDTNARQNFDPVKLQELADSLLDTTGVLQPLLGTLRADGEVDLIAGERRWRASGLAGFEEVEVKLVEKPSRKDHLKWNLVENLQREDLTPIETAMRVQEMLGLTDEVTGLPQYNRASLATELGISAESVGRYEQLLRAPEKVRKAVNDAGLDMLIGALIGSLPEPMRDQAANEMVFRNWGGPMKREDAQKHVAENYRRDLRKGQFNREDETLVPDAGACSGCPFFGGNREDVAGKARGYTCLNPECFDRKQQAHVNKVASTAESEGRKVLPQTMTNRVFQNWNNQVSSGCGYVDVKSAPDGYLLKEQKGKIPHWEKILEGTGAEVVVGFDHEGRVRRLVETKVAIEAAKCSEHAGLFKPKAGEDVESADDKKSAMQITKAKNKASKAALLEGLCAMYEKFSGQPWSRDVRLTLLADLCSNQTRDDLELLCRILQPDLKGISNAHAKLKELIELHLDTDAKIDGFMLIVRKIRSIHFRGFDFKKSGYDSMPDMLVYCAWAEFDAAGWDKKMDERIKDAEKEAKAAIREKNKPAKKAKAAGKGAQKSGAKIPVKVATGAEVLADWATADQRGAADPRVVLCEYTDEEDTADMIEALLNHEVPVTEPNEHGVFVRRAVFSCELATKVKFEIALAVDAGGMWHSCVSYQRGDTIGNQPGADCPDRKEAVREAAIKLVEEFEKPTKLKTYEGARKEALCMMHEIYGAGLGMQPAATKASLPVKAASKTKAKAKAKTHGTSANTEDYAKAAEKKTDWNGFASAAELDAQATRIQAGEGYPAVLGPRPAEGTPARKTWEAAKVRIWKEVKKREAAKSGKVKAKK